MPPHSPGMFCWHRFQSLAFHPDGFHDIAMTSIHPDLLVRGSSFFMAQAVNWYNSHFSTEEEKGSQRIIYHHASPGAGVVSSHSIERSCLCLLFHYLTPVGTLSLSLLSLSPDEKCAWHKKRWSLTPEHSHGQIFSTSSIWFAEHDKTRSLRLVSSYDQDWGPIHTRSSVSLGTEKRGYCDVLFISHLINKLCIDTYGSNAGCTCLGDGWFDCVFTTCP